MIKRVNEYDEQLYGDKQVWLDRRDMQYETIARYRAKLKQRAELDEKERPSLKRRRLDGGGRKALLPEEDELGILEWVKERRGGNRDHFAHVVTVQQLIAYASLRSGKTLTEGWVWGFMDVMPGHNSRPKVWGIRVLNPGHSVLRPCSLMDMSVL